MLHHERFCQNEIINISNLLIYVYTFLLTPVWTALQKLPTQALQDSLDTTTLDVFDATTAESLIITSRMEHQIRRRNSGVDDQGYLWL